jgi:hypothetical protein
MVTLILEIPTLILVIPTLFFVIPNGNYMDYLLMGKMRLPFIDSHLFYKRLPLRQVLFHYKHIFPNSKEINLAHF